MSKRDIQIIAALLIIALAVVVCSCQSPIPVAQSNTYPVVGWYLDYDAAIKESVTNDMILQPNSTMTKFCAEWPSLSIDQRRQFYADVLYAISSPESSYDRSTLYLEDALGKDRRTGLPVISEGLLQLSYGDVDIYSACEFDSISDKLYIVNDWNNHNPNSHTWHSIYSDQKTILDPIKNLKCGVAIIDQLLKTSEKEFADNLGRYWSSMRRSNLTYQKIWAAMRNRNSPCH